MSVTVANAPVLSPPASQLAQHSQQLYYRSHTASASGHAFSDAQFSSHGQGAFRMLESLFTVPMEILARSEPRAKVAAACIIHVWTYSRMLVYILHVYLWSDGAPSVLHA